MADLNKKEVLLQSGVADRTWKLKDTDPEEFKRVVREYFALCYPGYTVVRAKHPVIYLRDDRRKQLDI